ncbi:MAG: hypothetical protein Q4B50_06880 [Bacillota bacterium]|nr:hypothetical protein [Bacillota bacterium]
MQRKQLAFKGGSYSLIITAVVPAILIVVNILAAALPSSMTKYGSSVSKRYSITGNTKAVVKNPEQDTAESLSWEFVEDGLAFHKSGKGLLHDGDDAFPLGEDKINDILANFESFGAACSL